MTVSGKGDGRKKRSNMRNRNIEGLRGCMFKQQGKVTITFIRLEEGRECLRKEGSVQGVECQEQYLGSMRIDEINLTSTHKQPLKRGAGKITLSQDRTIIFTNT